MKMSLILTQDCEYQKVCWHFIVCEYLEYCEYCEYWEIGKKFGNLALSDIPLSAGGAICKLDFQSQETSDSLETISRQLQLNIQNPFLTLLETFRGKQKCRAAT